MPRRDAEAKRVADNNAILGRSKDARDIARGYPPAGDLPARQACERDLRRFLERYFPAAFALPWSGDHLKVLERMQQVALEGGLFALAMPRGSGKTTISVRAALWSLLYGHRRFVCLVGATEEKARRMLDSFKFELTLNPLLVADFRQVCYPLSCLENNARRCIGQLFDGVPTRITWSASQLTFPTLPAAALDGTDVGGSTLTVAGLTGAIRGQQHLLPDGRIVRPDLVVLDDPQTRESAMSAPQSERRAQIISGDVLGMAGPGRKITAIMPCTVIRRDDLADTFLDRKKKPEWSGQKTRMLVSWPTNMELWEDYRRILAESYQADRGPADANAYYAANREAMDAGAKVSWPENHLPDELSGIQHAMNLWIREPEVFAAEYQNEPVSEEDERPDLLTADQIAGRINRLPRGTVPIAATRITAFIDVHQELLYWVVAAWEEGFSGHVLAYGTYPDQKRPYFSLRDATRTLSTTHGGAGLEGRLHAGLAATCDQVLGREWHREDGSAMRVERCLIDANWGAQTDTVYMFCRESKFSNILIPSHGKGVGASGKSLLDWTPKPGDRKGIHWFMPLGRGRRAIRKAIFDANYWKSFVHARLATAPGDKASLSLFGNRPSAHRLFADHLTAEYPVRTRREGSSRVVDEWKLAVGKVDNHYLDCLVGCAVAASIAGVALPESTDAGRGRKRARVSFDEMQRRSRGA